jgi:uncharacterized protein
MYNGTANIHLLILGSRTVTKFIGRQEELKKLRDLSAKKLASFLVVRGRRRIGKTRLIEEFSKCFDRFYIFEGLAPVEGVTTKDQLEEFSRTNGPAI